MKLFVSCETCIWWDDEHVSLSMITFPYEAKWGYCCKHKPFNVGISGQHYGGWPLVDSKRGCAEHRGEEYKRK